MTRVTRRTPTCATCRIEHTCTLSLVSSFNHSSHSTWLKAVRTCLSPHLHVIHDVRLSLNFSTSPSTSPCFSPSSSCPSSWCPTTTMTPWQRTCATPPTGPSSPWTITSHSHERVLRGNSQDAEWSKCSMLIDSMKKSVDTCVCQRDCIPWHTVRFFFEMLCTRVARNRAPFAHHACSLLFHGGLQEERSCKVAHFAQDVIFLCKGWTLEVLFSNLGVLMCSSGHDGGNDDWWQKITCWEWEVELMQWTRTMGLLLMWTIFTWSGGRMRGW